MYTVESETSTAQKESPQGGRFTRHRVSAVLLAGLLVIVGLATAWNLEGWPGRVDDDEGTYVAQAWAIVTEHTLTHYAYWYDHPPGGWIQIAAFAGITDGFHRVTDAVFVGRQFMVVVTLISCVLVYLLCRRLGLRQATSAVAVLLFGLSPIAQYYHRMVSLDNIETMWVLAALVAATSPRRGWGPACRTGACTAIAILSKETALILVPVIVWVLLQRNAADGDPAAADLTAAAAGPQAQPADSAGPRAWAGGGTAAAASAATWDAAPGDPAAPVPGEADSPGGHEPAGTDGTQAPVWMPDWSAFAGRHRGDLGRVRTRLTSRPGQPRSTLPRSPRRPSLASGQVSRPQSLAVFAVTAGLIVLIYPLYALQRGELSKMWATLKFQFVSRPGSGSLLNSGSYTYSLVHTWVVTDPWLLVGGFVAALLMLLSRRLRPFSVALLLQIVILIHGGYLPFFYVTAVIPFAAVLIAGSADTLWTKIDFSRFGVRSGGGAAGGLAYLGRAVVAVVAVIAVVHVGPEWWSSLKTNSTANGDAPYLTAASWAEHHVPRNDVVVVDDYLWVDLRTHGLRPLWLWKISAQTAPSWRTIQYIILQPQSPAVLAGMPVLQSAYAHSVLVKDFGNGLSVRRVKDGS